MSGTLLCGTVITFASSIAAEILSISGLGANRRAADNSSGDSDWGDVLYSCVKRLKPFRVTCKFKSNEDWKAAIEAAASNCEIQWPTEDGYTTEGTLSFEAAVTDVDISGSYEDRMIKTLEITPRGEPTITPGTPV